jgi:site-specific DNA recombinase
MSKRIRCAIYTRKSTEEGLEQEFNSLDAQRESCEAYIQSQRGLGWVPMSKRYDDGGISGGTMDRPALRRLLTDIEIGKIDLVVVYKVDRLTRSLMDFSKIIETFDAREVSFVSVTQQFNTANSMGRLTLNVLLSFAQFEREVTAERIRDKIAASKKKGMWMGGLPPLGYDAIDKKLVINEAGAETVRTVFGLYHETKSVPKLVALARQKGIVTKVRQSKKGTTGGIPFSRGHLYHLLRNPIYVGDVRHKYKHYPGEHEAIIERTLWDEVQRTLESQAPARQQEKNGKQACLFTGLIYDETGDRLCPSHTRKGQRRYLYYVSKRLTNDPGDTENTWRLPAKELEKSILQSVINFLGDESRWMPAINSSASNFEDFKRLRHEIDSLIHQLGHPGFKERREAVINLFKKISVTPGRINVVISFVGAEHEFTLPFHTKRRGVESKIILGGNNAPLAYPDQNLIDVIQRSHQWWSTITEKDGASIKSLAEQATIDAADVTRFLPLVFLAPDVIEAILEGCQPIGLNLERLKKTTPIPADWHTQRLLLNFATK